MIALTPDRAWEYVATCDRALPPAQQTRWQLKVLTAADEAALQDILIQEEKGVQRTMIGTHTVTILRLGLAGVENFPDADGKDVAWETEEKWVLGRKRKVASDAILSRIPSMIRTELANAITSQKVTEAEAKN